jgi:UDP-N-acetylmuramoyl-tripeptide--D-alanyl-D-alanine ligase
MQCSQLASIVNGFLVGADLNCANIVIDSRLVQPGDCFIAIKGDVFDGHQFIADVAQKNPSVVIVSQDVDTTVPVIRVADTRQAFKDIARFYRENTTIPVAAITGSCGKTTTRALLENILKQKGNVLASKKSFNNDIGLPLTLLQLNASHDFAVLEIGTNHPGEIAALTKIATPTVAVVTMVAPVHIEHFGSVDAIAQEKGAIFEGLASEGVAVINADDVFCASFKKQAGRHSVVTFGCQQSADVMAHHVQSSENGQVHFMLQLPQEGVMVHLPLLGEHNVVNALAAAAMAFAMGISITDIQKGLQTVEPEYGRLVEKVGLRGAIVIDDSYNANPASVKAAINLLMHRSSHAILVLGDMAELGNCATEMHQAVGQFAKLAGVKKLLCYGRNSVHTARAFGEEAIHFDDHASLIAALKACVTADSTVLVKGSRSMKMEVVVDAIVNGDH